ncbi:MAG: DUF1549 domain-containing protein [Pirellulaceae bacterium]|nr:DUF1549 domain-containing protein [Pirellulaceae bacterium]
MIPAEMLIGWINVRQLICSAISWFLLTSNCLLADDLSSSTASSHWAHRPLMVTSLPKPSSHTSFDKSFDTSFDTWSRGPIDQFVLDTLRHRGLQPMGDATPAEFIRRLTFQLTGLPPGEAETQAFMADPSLDAVEQLVDRLLASPRFGERFGRHWLDLARYADSNGLDENCLFREAWRYRNWVRDALNEDMPYDRFLLEQIAGDLLPYTTTAQRDRQRIAAGFIVIGPKVLLGNNPENQRMEVADELLDTIGKVVLGQTLGCARCHDHKFDPVPTADYYALAGIFASTQVMERRFMLGEQRVMERLVGLGDHGDQLDEAYETFYRELPGLRDKAKKAGEAYALLRQAREELLNESELETFRDVLAPDASDPRVPPADRIEAQSQFVSDLKKKIASAPPIPPRAMIPADVPEPADETIRIAGKFDDKGEKVPRGFLSVLCEGDNTRISGGDSGRIDLARWFVDPQQRSGPLAARVMANRLWHHLIGRGLVRTVDNFGSTGETPSHPELLDYLARRLIDSDWSIKALIREIVLSHTFALSSQTTANGREVDPENQYLWRAHRRRLDPESFRDAMLMAAGQLDLTPMDSTVWYLGDQATAVGSNPVRRRTDFPCRSFYLPVIRNDLPELFEAMDFTNPHAATGARPITTAPSQAWFVLNDQMVMKAAEQTADRILQDYPETQAEQRVAAMFSKITGQTTVEVSTQQKTLEYIRQTIEQLQNQQAEQPERRAWSLACQALMASSRFQYLD